MSGGSFDNKNIASEDAHVDQQIGTQIVESVFHDATIYNLTDGDTAERRHEVALAYLVGGVPRRAENIFEDLVFSGHQSTERIYYYVLSVLSERGFGDLTADLVIRIDEVGKVCASLPADEWSQAHQVIRGLLDHAQPDGGDRSLTAVTAFGDLPGERQEEISRHLSLLVSGVVERQLDAERKHEVSTERFSRNRVEQVWKFFEPDPVKPVRYRTRTFTEIEGIRSALVGGVVGVLAFAGLFFGPLDLLFWSGLVLLVVGGFVMARYGIEYTGHLLHIAFRHETPEPVEESSAMTPVDRLVERCFKEACPEYAENWSEYAAGYRLGLRRRFNDQLKHDPNYKQTVKQVKWLIDWHARRVAQQWPHHDLHLRPDPGTPGNVGGGKVAGVLMTLAGLALLGLAQRWQVVPIAVGGWFALSAVIEFFAARRADQHLGEDADALFVEEMAEYRRWLGELSDRPNDSEMARWLALDKAYLKTEALRRGNIAEQDLVSHVVINQRAPWARRGVVPHGPPRYQAYLVTVILLTQHGVRASRVYLDFTTGEVKNEDWNVFGYDRIASASLKVREKPAGNGVDEPERKVRDREFRLRLLDGAEILNISERLDVGGDTEVDDETELDRLAAATSGMDAALPVLEAVAHQGKAWIELQKDRREVWSRVRSY